MKVEDLKLQLTDHSDAGVAMRIQRAIGELVEEKKFDDDTELTFDNLFELRRKLYVLKPDMSDLLGALGRGGSKNPGEAALQYVEALMRSLPKPKK